MSKFFCVFLHLVLAVSASASLSSIPDYVLHLIIEWTVLFSFKSSASLPLVSHRFNSVTSFPTFIPSSSQFVTPYVSTVKQQWDNGQLLPTSNLNLRWGDITKQHAFLAHVIEFAETRYHLPAETVDFLCILLTLDLFKMPETQGIELFKNILTSRPPYAEMADKGKEKVLKSLMSRNNVEICNFLKHIRQNACGVPEFYEPTIQMLISGECLDFFAEGLCTSTALDGLVVANRLSLPEAGRVLFQKAFHHSPKALVAAVYPVLTDDDFDGERTPEREQYKDQLTTAIFKLHLLPVTPYQEYFLALWNKNLYELFDFCTKTPQFPLRNLPSCLIHKLIVLHHCGQVSLERLPRTASVCIDAIFSFSYHQLPALICNTGWARGLGLSEGDRAMAIRALNRANGIVGALRNLKGCQQEARDFVCKYFSYRDFIPFNQHYECWMAMARHVREDEKAKMLAMLNDIVSQSPPQFPHYLLPLEIVLQGELRDKWSVDEIGMIMRTLGRTGPFTEGQIDTLCALLTTTDPSIIAQTVLTHLFPTTNGPNSQVRDEMLQIIARSPLNDHFASNLLLQIINSPSVISPKSHLFGLLNNANFSRKKVLFGKILTRRLPGFTGLSDRQVNDALDALEAANSKSFYVTRFFEMHFLLDVLTAGDEQAVGILMGRSEWKLDVRCNYFPKEWFGNPAKRQNALLILRELDRQRTGQ